MWWLSMMFVFFGDSEADRWTWKQRTFDVYVNGEAQPQARVYANKPFNGYLLVLDDRTTYMIQAEDSVYRAARLEDRPFEAMPHRISLRSEPLDMPAESQPAKVIDGRHLLWRQGQRTLLMARHDGIEGEHDEERLWRHVSAWRDLYDAYEPDADAMQRLGGLSLNEPLEIHVVYGTWCGDSRREVPRLLKTLAKWNHPRIKVRLTGVANGFKQPWEVIGGQKITNVPTIMVHREGKEIARLVEHAPSEAIEKDLPEMLRGTFTAPEIKGEDDTLISQGHQEHQDPQGTAHRYEYWRLYRTAKGGYRINAGIESGETTIDLRLKCNEEGKPTFWEITRKRGQDLRRSRGFVGKKRITVVTRGSDSGIVRQDLPPGTIAALHTPSPFINRWLAERRAGGACLQITELGAVPCQEHAAPATQARHQPQK